MSQERLAQPESSKGLSRRHFLMGAAICAGGLLASRVPAQADIIDTLNKFFDLDPTVLNYAAEMEELEKEFFTRALYSKAYGELSSREQNLFHQIAKQDTAHFEALTMERNRRGTKLSNSSQGRNQSFSPAPRNFRVPSDAFSSRDNLLKEAILLKENVLYAYHGAVHVVADAKLLGPAAAIAGVESRHVVVLREMAGMDPVPTSFEGQVSPQTVGRFLGNRYGFQGGNDRLNSGGF